MRNFIGKPINQCESNKYLDKNGVPLRVGDTCRHQYLRPEPEEAIVSGLDQNSVGDYNEDGVRFFFTKSGTYEWDRAKTISKNYEVIRHA